MPGAQGAGRLSSRGDAPRARTPGGHVEHAQLACRVLAACHREEMPPGARMPGGESGMQA